MRTTITLENVEAQTGRVNELMRRYRHAVAPDCHVRTEADRWYFRAVAWACIGLICPPLLLATAWCVAQAKQSEREAEA